jgi:hypothetical protein
MMDAPRLAHGLAPSPIPCSAFVITLAAASPRATAAPSSADVAVHAGSLSAALAAAVDADTSTCTPMKKRTVPSLSFIGASVNMFQKGLPLRL